MKLIPGKRLSDEELIILEKFAAEHARELASGKTAVLNAQALRDSFTALCMQLYAVPETCLLMTVQDAADVVYKWTRGNTFHPDSTGPKAAAMVLLNEVKQQREFLERISQTLTRIRKIDFDNDIPRSVALGVLNMLQTEIDDTISKF